MPGLNSVYIAGHLTRDVEVRHIASGTVVADASVAVSERKKNKDGSWGETTSFIDVTLWGKLAESFAASAKKGAGVFVAGKLKQESWVDKASGQKRSKLKVEANQAYVCGTNEKPEEPDNFDGGF